MIRLADVQGAIFDLDDTLLDNGPMDKPSQWLHSRSRLAAIQEAGETHNLEGLRHITPSENSTAFTTAKIHSIEGAVWNVLHKKGLVASNEIDTHNPLYSLVEEIAARKNELHESILIKYGVEIPGASDFVRGLAAAGMKKHLAIATSALRRDCMIFLEKYDLNYLFPEDHIISAEKVTKPKPDPQCFELAFLSLGLAEKARKNVLAFEDNPRGIVSAKAAGLYVCAITTRLMRDDPAMIEARPDIIADSFEEFKTLLGLQS